jgi:hypothetical protein
MPSRSRRLVVAAVVIFAALSAPTGAQAHLRAGVVAVDYRVSISLPRPSSRAAFSTQVYESDRALHLAVRTGHTVVVFGYLGEPFLRLNNAGLAVNKGSPTSAASGLLKNAQRVSSADTAWLLKPGRNSVVWHDARVQGLAPGVSHGHWSVPLLVDGRHIQLNGEIWRLRSPSLWPWPILVALFVVGSALLALPRRAEAARIGSIVLGVLAGATSIATALAFALDTYASPGTRIAGADEVVFAAVGFGVLAWGPRQAHVAAAAGLGLLSLAIGLSKVEVFLHARLLAALPDTAARVVVAVAIGAGTAAVVLGGVFYLAAASETNSSRASARFRNG